MLSCVGFANTPRLLSRRHSCHAVLRLTLLDSSMTIALNNPFPRTEATSGELKALTPERKTLPSLCDLSTSLSSTMTCRAVIETAHPNGFLVRLCSYHILITTAEFGRLPAICTSVFSRFNAEHDILISQDGRNRVHWKHCQHQFINTYWYERTASRQGLSQ